jgi:reactive chlorine resistance protein C
MRTAATLLARRPASRVPDAASTLRRSASVVLRYGLVAIIGWFGAFKFTPTEAQAIQPLLAHSPLLGWLYGIVDVTGVSRLIGSVELAIAGLIALRPLAPRLSAVGSLGAVAMFTTTLSFLATTPDVWVHVDGFVVPNETGAFLVKDVFLLGAALWTASEALDAARLVHRTPSTVKISER